MSEFLKEWAEKHRAEFYSHVPMWIAIGSEACKAARRQINYAEYAGLITLLEGANSYTRKVLLPLLDDDAVCELAEYCMSQIGPECGELELARHYGDSLERELAPMLVRRLHGLSQFVASIRPMAEEWGRWRETIAHLKETAAGQQKRADRLETELNGAAVLVAAQREEIAQLLLDKTDYLARCVVACHDLKKQLQIAETKLGAEAAELDLARQEAAAWEVQCQDLRDKLVQLHIPDANVPTYPVNGSTEIRYGQPDIEKVAAFNERVAEHLADGLQARHHERLAHLSPQPKPKKPSRSVAYLQHVRQHDCCNCGAFGPSDPDHVGPRGVGQKTSDYNCIPLCRACHRRRTDKNVLPEADKNFGGPAFDRSRSDTELIILRAQVQCLREWAEKNEKEIL